MRIELADRIPYAFPFVAMLRGEALEHRRIDRPVIVQGFQGLERHYFRIETAPGVYSVANDSMLYVEA